MSPATHEERLQRRIAEIATSDKQFAAAFPSEAVAATVQRPGYPCPKSSSRFFGVMPIDPRWGNALSNSSLTLRVGAGR